MRTRPAPLLIAVAALAAVVLSVSCSSRTASSSSSSSPTRTISVRESLAKALLHNPRISLAAFHISGRRDNATALENIRQAAAGRAALRSSYQRAPGGSTPLDHRMLRAMNQLAREGYTFRVTEIAGGSHSGSSKHYAGTAFDVDYINGIKVGSGNPYYRGFMRRCRELGALDVSGPGDPGHRTHVHVSWTSVIEYP